MKQPDITSVWKRIESWLEANAPALLEQLRPGVDQEEFERIQKKFPFDLPEDIKTSYMLCNGSSNPSFLAGHDFLALKRMYSEWQGMNELGFGDDLPNVGQARGPVKPLWWHDRWVPFGANIDGDLLCVDMDPEPGGKSGQVVCFYNDHPEREVLSQSFALWLDNLAQDLEEDFYVLDQHGNLRLAEELAEEQEEEEEEAEDQSVENTRSYLNEATGLLSFLMQKEVIDINRTKDVTHLAAQVAVILEHTDGPEQCSNMLVDAFLAHPAVEEFYFEKKDLRKLLEQW